MNERARHILSLSGGKDSTALAIYMRDRIPEMEYVFHDTEKELPETYEYLERLEVILGKPIRRSKPKIGFDHWFKVYGDIIPSNHRRWCTRMLKLKPFEEWIGDDVVYNYIGIRADEDRTGYISHKANLIPVYPFREDGLGYADVVRILEEAGLGLPGYTSWGRTRSGCFFCFYQQKIEWVRLRERYPDLYEEAKRYEKANKINGNVFYWCGNESLEDLERPERIAEIKCKWEQSRGQTQRSAKKKSLLHILGELEDPDEPQEGCLICQL